MVFTWCLHQWFTFVQLFDTHLKESSSPFSLTLSTETFNLSTLTQLHHQNPKKLEKRANLSKFQFTNPYKQGFLISYV